MQKETRRSSPNRQLSPIVAQSRRDFWRVSTVSSEPGALSVNQISFVKPYRVSLRG